MESLWLQRHHPSWSPLSSSAVSKVVIDDGNIPNVNTSLLYESRNCLNCDFTFVVVTNHIPLSTYANLWQTLLLDWRKLERSNEPRTTTLHQFHSIPHQECIKYRRKTKTFNVRLKKLTWNSVFGYSNKCFIPKNSCTSLKNCIHAKRMPVDAQWN